MSTSRKPPDKPADRPPQKPAGEWGSSTKMLILSAEAEIDIAKSKAIEARQHEADRQRQATSQDRKQIESERQQLEALRAEVEGQRAKLVELAVAMQKVCEEILAGTAPSRPTFFPTSAEPSTPPKPPPRRR